jgi:hypothetical protein
LSPSFTAINQKPLQLVSLPQSSAIPQTQQNHAKIRTTGKSGRCRNPTVASYLGLGDSVEPAHLVRYAPTPNGQSPLRSMRKRRVQDLDEKAATRKGATLESKKPLKHRRVSEENRVTEHLNQPATHKPDGLTSQEPLPIPASTAIQEATIDVAEQPQIEHQELFTHSIVVERINISPTEAANDAAASTPSDDNFDQLCFDFEANAHTTDKSSQPVHNLKLHQVEGMRVDEDDFDEDLMDDDFLDITADMADDSRINAQSSLPIMNHTLDEPNRETLTYGMSVDVPIVLDEQDVSSGLASKKFVSPVTLTTRLIAANGDEAHKPIVRLPFPSPVRDRSPIIGLSSSTLLRTCFRVGEAVNQSRQAVKTGNTILIELYARVLNSERDESQQWFTFCDLFHAKPPYIQAVYVAAIWKPVQLFEYDSRRLLQQGKICRCIGTMKCDGKDWVMTVLNIWEATWDDVQWVEGIVNS